MANLEPTRFNDIVISENRWRSVEGPRHPILVSKGSTSDSRTPNGERSSKRCSVTIWSRAADLRFPSGSETLSLPMRARSLRSRSHARLYVPSAEAPRTGNGGDWQRPYAGQLRGDANEPKTRNRAGVNPNQFTVHGSGATSEPGVGTGCPTHLAAASQFQRKIRHRSERSCQCEHEKRCAGLSPVPHMDLASPADSQITSACSGRGLHFRVA